MKIPETDGEISSGVSTKAFEDELCISSCILCTSCWQIDVDLDTVLHFLFPNVSSLRLQIDVLTYNLLISSSTDQTFWMAPFRFFTDHRHLLQMYFALSTFMWKGKLFSSSFTLKTSLPLLLLSTKFLSLFLSMEVLQTTHNLSAIFFHCFVGSNDQKIKQTKRRSSCTTLLMHHHFIDTDDFLFDYGSDCWARWVQTNADHMHCF